MSAGRKRGGIPAPQGPSRQRSRLPGPTREKPRRNAVRRRNSSCANPEQRPTAPDTDHQGYIAQPALTLPDLDRFTATCSRKPRIRYKRNSASMKGQQRAAPDHRLPPRHLPGAPESEYIHGISGNCRHMPANGPAAPCLCQPRPAAPCPLVRPGTGTIRDR